MKHSNCLNYYFKTDISKNVEQVYWILRGILSKKPLDDEYKLHVLKVATCGIAFGWPLDKSLHLVQTVSTTLHLDHFYLINYT